jgi:hypothetical protein
MSETADGRLQIAFRIDQEVGGHHHPLAVLDALDNFNIGIAARAELDLARLEATFAGLDQHDAAGSTVDDGRDGHRDNGPFRRDGTSIWAYMPGLSNCPGLASSTRTGMVRVSAVSVG